MMPRVLFAIDFVLQGSHALSNILDIQKDIHLASEHSPDFQMSMSLSLPLAYTRDTWQPIPPLHDFLACIFFLQLVETTYGNRLRVRISYVILQRMLLQTFLYHLKAYLEWPQKLMVSNRLVQLQGSMFLRYGNFQSETHRIRCIEVVPVAARPAPAAGQFGWGKKYIYCQKVWLFMQCCRPRSALVWLEYFYLTKRCEGVTHHSKRAISKSLCA